ncbi:glycosyltransferase [Marinomonas polaris]|uniref:glycosyltransferase n=1 Tax=Marinomonas polaris TaxID=293552 RepID=UPI003F9CB2F5
MKKNAVVFTVSSDLIFAVANLMLDIKRITPEIADEVVVIHNGINKKDLELLNSILPVRDIFYEIPVDDLSIFNQDTLRYFTIMAYAKYECLRLLSDYKNIIYLDPDMIILKDLSGLLEPCESGVKMMPSGALVSSQLHQDINDYDMNKEGICGALFCFQDHIDYMKYYNFCVFSLNKYAGFLKLAEQAIFDFMIQEFDIKIQSLDFKIYSPHPRDKDLIPNAKIIHAYGQPKFWNGLNDEHWNSNYQEWLSMGGSKYKKPTFVSKVIKKLNSIVK